MSEDPQLRTLIKRARRGDQEAFRELFDITSNKIFSYALSHTNRRDDALDITQETYIELWRSLRKFQYQSDEAFYGFIFTIVKRKLYRYYSSRKPVDSLEEAQVEASYELEYEDYRHLMRALKMLTPKQQDIMRLRYWSGCTFAEIASTLNIKETTAKVNHHRAVEHIRFTLNT